MLSTKQTAHAALVTANIIFGAGNIVSKVGLKGTNPVVFALVREVVSGPLLLIISLAAEWRRQKAASDDEAALAPTKPLLERLHALRWRLLLCGAALFGTNFCYIVGVKLSGPTTGAVWQSAQPLFITLMAVALRFEACSPYKAGGILLAVFGCVFVSVEGSSFNSNGLVDNVLGNLLFFLQTFCVSIFYVGQKPLLKELPPITVLAYAYLIASCVMAIIAGIVSSSPQALQASQ